MPFDPSAHMRQYVRNQKTGQKDRQGKDIYAPVTSDYLDVRWRLVWLRGEHPDAVIVTDLHMHEPGYALFRATVTLPAGGSATGWGSETREDFGDYLEKAETKALGRALAALGYGTAHAAELDEGGSVADAPVEKRLAATIDNKVYEISVPVMQQYGSVTSASASAPIPPLPAGNLAPRPEPGVTDALLRKLHATARDKGWTAEGVKTAMRDLWGVESSKQLSSRQAGELIDLIEDRLMVDRYDGKPVLVRVPVEPLVNQLADAVR